MVCISIVIPVYNTAEFIEEIYTRVKNAMSILNKDFELIFVNDGSKDNAWEKISELALKEQRVKGINLSRNFGQHYAIAAGLDFSSGEWVVVMDCDLQDQPEEIIKLYNKAIEGYDIVLGKRMRRNDTFFKIYLSKIFYFILGFLTDTKQDSTIGNFGIYNRKTIDAICSMNDSFRYFPTMVRWVGFKNTQIEIEHAERKSGKTNYNFRKLFELGTEVILSFSEKPLKLTIKLGMGISLLSIIFAVINIYRYFTGDIKLLGFASLIVSIWFLSGIIIFVIGIIGLYIGKTFERTKNRPLYIVKDYANRDINKDINA